AGAAVRGRREQVVEAAAGHDLGALELVGDRHVRLAGRVRREAALVEMANGDPAEVAAVVDVILACGPEDIGVVDPAARIRAAAVGTVRLDDGRTGVGPRTGRGGCGRDADRAARAGERRVGHGVVEEVLAGL